MRQHLDIAISKVPTVSGSFGSVQLVPADRQLMIAVNANSYDTFGFLHIDTASVRLPPEAVARLADLLNDIVQVENDPRQTSLWSSATFAIPPIVDPRSARRYGWQRVVS